MSGRARLRERLYSYTGSSLSERFRRRRWAALAERFPELPAMRVIDLGGTTWDWTMGYAGATGGRSAAPKEVLVVNLDDSALTNPSSWIRTLCADVCALPQDVLDAPFDLVYSNSLIEHVGGRWRRERMAEAIHGLAEHHWVQTPWRYFPVEPHWMFPCFQFLPAPARARISRRWPLTPSDLRGEDLDGALEGALSVELLTAAELRRLFPGSELRREKVAGVTKSLIAVR